MTVVLAVAIGLLLLDRIRLERAIARERKTLLNAVVARDPREFRALEREPKPKRERDEESIDFPVGT